MTRGSQKPRPFRPNFGPYPMFVAIARAFNIRSHIIAGFLARHSKPALASLECQNAIEISASYLSHVNMMCWDVKRSADSCVGRH
jgi:hypothetical protein